MIWILWFQAELKFIESNVQADNLKKLPFPPFKKIFTSKAYWGLQIAHIGGTYGTFTLIAAGPTYLKNIHHVAIQQVIQKKYFWEPCFVLKQTIFT